MIEFSIGPNDAPEFIRQVTELVNDEVAACSPELVYAVQIDHAFDQKWLGYSGNPIQHVAVWKQRLTVPPFHPNRVRFQKRFVREGSVPPSYASTGTGESLHLRQESSANLNRYLDDVSPSAIFVWYSGDSAVTGRGTLMIYHILPQFSDKWFATFRGDDGWRLHKHRTISVAAQ